MRPFIDIYFSVTENGGGTRFFKGANEIDQKAWNATDDPQSWWI